MDKAVNKLTLWNAGHINLASKLMLVKYVLTSLAAYFLTSFRAPKETLKQIEKKRKQFLWDGATALTGEMCKIDWLRLARPKYMGGPGILHRQKLAKGP